MTVDVFDVYGKNYVYNSMHLSTQSSCDLLMNRFKCMHIPSYYYRSLRAASLNRVKKHLKEVL